MSLKVKINYSPNFTRKKRTKKDIKFLIFHYTGMKNENLAIKRLTDIQSEVASHYFIKRSGEIILFVPDLFIAWHAGISEWKKSHSLNKNSIGIEISNPGHNFEYKKFSKKQINSLIKLTRFLIGKYKINRKNILGHSDIAPLRKKDPGEKFPWKYLAKKNIGYWHHLDQKKLARYRNKECNRNLKNRFFNYLYKIGYSKNYKNQSEKLIVKAFQRRFRPELVSGIIDQECLYISKNLS